MEGVNAEDQPGATLATDAKDLTPSNTGKSDWSRAFVSILMLTHNAPKYVDLSIRSLEKYSRNFSYELVVLDNKSDDETVQLVKMLHNCGAITKLKLLDRNSLFSEGNNIAAEMASADATHFLLLNSDIEVKSSEWMIQLMRVHSRGITSYGIAINPDRVDGYCLLIDADIYRKYKLDEGHQWWWAVTKMQAQVLNAGYAVRGYIEHEEYLHHFGGKSGDAFKSAKGMNVTRDEVVAWFNGKKPTVIYSMDSGHSDPLWRFVRLRRRLWLKVRRLCGRR